ncbi:hypothetical protein MMC25_004755 [Agyrium rufum]|nr:hypothetical protein [Agyrium rufum]
MAYHSPPHHQSSTARYSPTRSSPLRHTSNASTSSSAYTNHSDSFLPSRTSTVSSATSSAYSASGVGRKRDIQEAGMVSPVKQYPEGRSYELSTTNSYKSTRQSLRALPQPPNGLATSFNPSSNSYLGKGGHSDESQNYPHDGSSDYIKRASLSGEYRSSRTSRDGTPTPSSILSNHSQLQHGQSTVHTPLITTPELSTLSKSSTAHLRTLSKFASSGSNEDFSLTTPAPSVAGLHGRRQLKRNDSVRASKGPITLAGGTGYGWAGRSWMDQQRQFLQAYEYLCHIGEAKEWIEDVIHKPIPPIVQLEEALRDGVTLAEIVQEFTPNRTLRIFRNPKLQFRHSDNIALFFRFLSDIELPELFRFELIDLYEKKNIPKVIYCIHALSWLLFRTGMVKFRIGNLVGQLQFEDHELEEVQKGLDKAGVSMPSFSGMGASFGAEPEPEPEPVESEEERVQRQLAENEASIADLQSQIRGALMRMNLGNTMQNLWDGEELLIELQSRIRGDWARQIVNYKLQMRLFAVNLQSASRGYLARKQQRRKEHVMLDSIPDIIQIQSLIRARRPKQELQRTRNLARREESGIKSFQAAIRGAMQRKRLNDQYEETLDAERGVETLQAAARGMLARHFQRRQLESLVASSSYVTELQTMIRGMQARQSQHQQETLLKANLGIWRALQASARGALLRGRMENMRGDVEDQSVAIIRLQAFARGIAARRRQEDIRQLLARSSQAITAVQALARAFISRKQHSNQIKQLRNQSVNVTQLQGFIRGASARTDIQVVLDDLDMHAPEIIELQALSRAMLLRFDVGNLLGRLDEEEQAIEALQAAARGRLIREKFAEKKRFFKENMEKVVKVQSFIRGKIQGQAYKSLTSGKNPPVGTVKGFVHLLNDSDFDFDEEVEFERLRKTVVQHVRQNEMADQYITQLDIKIALLVKNKITLDEVVKHQKHFGGSVGSLLTNTEMGSKDPFDLKALNKNSRRKLEHYQELFFVLQTQPQYLARLFRRIREQATAEKECERTKHLVIGLFGYAQKRREEYYLLKLITKAIKEEVDACSSLQDYLRGNFFWARVFSGYIKSPRDRKYIRDLLGNIVKENIIDNPDLDLESDPMQIYLKAIENEQLRTGRRSQRPSDIPREEAIRDEETKRTFIAHLQELRDIADQIFGSLEDLLHKMPYGVRYIAQQTFQNLTSRFRHEEPGHILQIVGQWLWKSYIQPAILEPEKFGVVDRGLSQEHKRNLAEVAKVVGQAAVGRLFGSENIFLQPLNSYIGETIQRLGEIWGNVIAIPDAETQFDIDEFNDLYAKTKPTLYIKMADIFSIHHIVANEAACMCPSQNDTLRDIIRELGSAKTNESELMGVSSSEICLTLNPKLHDTKDPDAEIKTLFTETKRCILYLIRVQSGANLMEIMVKPITAEDEHRWATLVREELSQGNSARGAYYSEATSSTMDLSSMPYAELKRTALENILHLESLGRLTRHNYYQDLLNAIAVDIRTKHRRRIQRQRELEGVRLTLARLDEQAVWLESQLKTYNDYIEQAMVTLQNKKGKKRFLMPFTKQWEHERELIRSGRVPKFGSFKYSAAELANRGILVAWKGYAERQWNQLDLTISSNEVGVFAIEGSSGSIAIPGASARVPLDDLLQAQYNGMQFLEFFGGGELRVSVNLFLHLIMRKFYKDGES